MKEHIRLKKRAKEIISIIVTLIVGIFIAHLLCNISIRKYEKAGKFCDSIKGYTCTHYEIEQILRRGY